MEDTCVIIKARGERYTVYTTQELLYVQAHLSAKHLKCRYLLSGTKVQLEVAKDALTRLPMRPKPVAFITLLRRTDGQHGDSYYVAIRQSDGKILSFMGFFTEDSENTYVQLYVNPEEAEMRVIAMGYKPIRK